MFSWIRGLATLLLCLAAIGLYRGWFTLSSPSRDPQTHRVNVNVSVDETRLKSDAENAEKFGEKVADRVKQHRDTAEAQPPRPDALVK